MALVSIGALQKIRSRMPIPFIFVGGAIGALGVWSAAPMAAAAMMAFLAAFQVKVEILTKPRS
ncbi:hypothetical protein [Streptomyces sp. NPDC015242]|uniref:hypothetical protein n=1 Tax=Streptomyces sp. NPDC015242 TaxID=3364951 RepID=UPI0036FE2364